MSTNINLKNSTDTTFSITHSDGANTKVLDSKDIAVAIDTVADFPANPNNGDVVIVRDLNRGGTFIYDSSEVAGSNDGTNFDGWIRQYSGAVNVKWFGVSTEHTNNQIYINKAVDVSNNLYFPNGTYYIDDTILLGESTKIIGQNRLNTIIYNSSDSFSFMYESPLSGGDLNTGMRFESFTLRCKNGIKINQSGDYNTLFKLQRPFKGLVVTEVLITGRYWSGIDPNYKTDIKPTRAELIEYGVGLYLAKCFTVSVNNMSIESFGIGIFGDGLQVSTIDNIRMVACARLIHLYGHDTYGGGCKILNSDLIAHSRVGAIYLEGTTATQISRNYFEDYTAAATYLMTDNDRATVFSKNHINNTTQGSTPLIHMKPAFENFICDNLYIPGGTKPPIYIDSTNWTSSYPVLCNFIGNDSKMPVPYLPGVFIKEYDRFLFSYNNYNTGAGTLSGSVISGGMPFELSSITNRYSIKTGLGNLITYFDLTGLSHKKYLFTLTGVSIYGGGYTVITYQENGFSDTEVFRGSTLGFNNTVESESRTTVVEIPLNRKGSGKFKVEVVCAELSLESIKIEPVSYLNRSSVPTSGRYRVGDIVWNTSPTSGGSIGWVCTVAGSPGTWKTFGAITA